MKLLYICPHSQAPSLLQWTVSWVKWLFHRVCALSVSVSTPKLFSKMVVSSAFVSSYCSISLTTLDIVRLFHFRQFGQWKQVNLCVFTLHFLVIMIKHICTGLLAVLFLIYKMPTHVHFLVTFYLFIGLLCIQFYLCVFMYQSMHLSKTRLSNLI